MTATRQYNIDAIMDKNHFEIETITESRSWKERKKRKNSLVFYNRPSIENPLRSFKNLLSVKSSVSTQDNKYLRSNHVSQLCGEETITSKVTIYPHYLNVLFAVYLSILTQRLLICMPNLTSSFCNDKSSFRKEHFVENHQKLKKRKNEKSYSFPLNSNLMGVCSHTTKMFFFITLISTFETGCHGLKNEFCKFNYKLIFREANLISK